MNQYEFTRDAKKFGIFLINVFLHYVFFTYTAWEMALKTSHLRVILKIQNPVNVLILRQKKCVVLFQLSSVAIQDKSLSLYKTILHGNIR